MAPSHEKFSIKNVHLTNRIKYSCRTNQTEDLYLTDGRIRISKSDMSRRLASPTKSKLHQVVRTEHYGSKESNV
jgi:hypothetical protein